jgi:hypothetical protein
MKGTIISLRPLNYHACRYLKLSAFITDKSSTCTITMHCRYDEGPARVGWMFNMLPTSLPDADGREKSGLDMYFLEEDGGKFKVYTLSISSITLHLL